MLLDTHVLLWFKDGDTRLGCASREIIDASFQDDTARFAAISLWEIGMLLSRQHIALAMPPDDWIARAVAEGLKVVGITGDIALDAGMMPRNIHGDPCDRIIMATARALNCPLLTADHRLLDYSTQGWLRTIDARR